MRNAMLQLPEERTDGERRKVLRAAVRQLERADLYFDAVESMDIGDPDAKRALTRLKKDAEALRRYLLDLRSQA